MPIVLNIRDLDKSHVEAIKNSNGAPAAVRGRPGTFPVNLKPAAAAGAAAALNNNNNNNKNNNKNNNNKKKYVPSIFQVMSTPRGRNCSSCGGGH